MMTERLDTLDSFERRAQRFESGGTVWRRWGKGSPMLLLHGGAGSWAHWIRNIDALAAERSVWIPDMPGLGDSEMPPAPRDHMAVAETLAPCVDALMPPDARFHLIGFSFGGIVGAYLAALRPDRVRTLVLVGAGGLGLRKGQAPVVKPWRHLTDPAEMAAVHRHNLGALMFSSPERIDALAMQLYARDIVRTRINSAKSSRADPLKVQLTTRHLPVHGIWGRLDITARGRFDEIAAMLRTSNPEARLRIVEDAGHWVQYEQPERFQLALREILAHG